MVSVRVALPVHALSNEIGGKVSHVYVIKLHLVDTSVKDGVVIGVPNGSAISGMFACNDSATSSFAKM